MTLAAALLLPAGIAAAKPVPKTSPAEVVTIDDHLLGHLSYPDVVRAEEFMAKQEALGTRPAPRASGYGKKGCTSPTYNVDDERKFWVSDYDLGQTVQKDFILAAKSEHGYLWVDKAFFVPTGPAIPERGFVTRAEAEEALRDWEKIYKIDRAYFGKQPDPRYPAQNLAPGLPKDWRDADCDKHISILNFNIDTPGVGVPPAFSTSVVAGYYSSEHEYPNGEGEHESPHSNEMEMFFMNSGRLDVGSDTYAGVIAHEFFHMIQFSNDYNEATWVNEGMADVAIAVNGFTSSVDGHVNAYQNQPDNHLLDWGSSLADYGQAFLFFDYLFNHYGAPENKDTKYLEAYGLAKLLTRTPPDGPKGVTKVIKTRTTNLKNQLRRYYRTGNFNKVFKDYVVANYLDKPGAAKGQYGYKNRTVHVKSVKEQQTIPGSTTPDSASATVHPYAGEYYEFAPGQEGQLQVGVERKVAVIPANQGQPKPAGGYFAWTNRADEMITWLQRPANLTGAASPKLQFRYWYQIEEDWDYVYVRVSEDGGKTFDFVPTPECGGRATDPNGNNRATTESGGITGDSEGWKTCTLDLSKYAGKKVLVRFEYDTDQAVTEPGFVVDNVQMKDGTNVIWKKQRFERKRTPFKFGGDGILKFLRIKPLAKNKPLVQVVRVSGKRVARKVYTRKHFRRHDKKFNLRKPATLAGQRSILIVTSKTPIATDPFAYNYELLK